MCHILPSSRCKKETNAASTLLRIVWHKAIYKSIASIDIACRMEENSQLLVTQCTDASSSDGLECGRRYVASSTPAGEEFQDVPLLSCVFSHGRELRQWLSELFPEIDDRTQQRAKDHVCVALETYFREKKAPPPKAACGCGRSLEPKRGSTNYFSRKRT